MTSASFLSIAMIALCLAIVWAASVQLRARRWTTMREQRRPDIEAATRALVDAVVRDEARDDARHAMTCLPVRRRAELVSRVAAGIEGPELERLRLVAADCGVVERAGRALLDDRWWVRLRGVGALSALAIGDPAQHELLHDDHGAVRAATVVWLDRTGLHGPLVRAVVPLLADVDGTVRHAARDALADSPAAVEAIRDEILQPSDPMSLAAALEIAAELHDSALTREAEQWRAHETASVRAAAAGAMVDASDPSKLGAFFSDDEPMVRRAAVRAAAAGRRRSLAGRVGHLLEDPDWRVRDAAIDALGALGPEGEIIGRSAAARAEAAKP